MTNRRKPAQRTTGAAWKPTRPRSELMKAVGAAAGIVIVTALLIFLMKPADSTATPSEVPVTPTQPASDTTTSTVATQPTDSTTTPTQPADTSSTTTQP